MDGIHWPERLANLAVVRHLYRCGGGEWLHAGHVGENERHSGERRRGAVVNQLLFYSGAAGTRDPVWDRPLTKAVTALGERLGFEVSTRISQHLKIYLRTTSADGTTLRIKAENNTHERSPARPLISMPHTVDSPW